MKRLTTVLALFFSLVLVVACDENDDSYDTKQKLAASVKEVAILPTDCTDTGVAEFSAFASDIMIKFKYRVAKNRGADTIFVLSRGYSQDGFALRSITAATFKCAK